MSIARIGVVLLISLACALMPFRADATALTCVVAGAFYAPTIVGAGEITGTLGMDIIQGSDGDDTIFGLGGNDKICSGDGNDTIYGGDGPDLIDSGPGGDVIYGGADGDAIFAGLACSAYTPLATASRRWSNVRPRVRCRRGSSGRSLVCRSARYGTR